MLLINFLILIILIYYIFFLFTHYYIIFSIEYIFIEIYIWFKLQASSSVLYVKKKRCQYYHNRDSLTRIMRWVSQNLTREKNIHMTEKKEYIYYRFLYILSHSNNLYHICLRNYQKMMVQSKLYLMIIFKLLLEDFYYIIRSWSIMSSKWKYFVPKFKLSNFLLRNVIMIVSEKILFQLLNIIEIF